MRWCACATQLSGTMSVGSNPSSLFDVIGIEAKRSTADSGVHLK